MVSEMETFGFAEGVASPVAVDAPEVSTFCWAVIFAGKVFLGAVDTFGVSSITWDNKDCLAVDRG